VFFSDLVFGIVPDAAILIGVVGAAIYRLPFTVYGLLWPAAAAGAFFLFLVLITRGRGMGTGDVTLAAFLGLWLGWPKILLAVWLAFLIGAVWGIGLILLGRKKFGQTIPFGPFMIAGGIIAEIWGLTLLQLFLTI
jgi:prepilin signal peptidase PulO-like enzyme (type II secretory pathway)